MKRKFSVTKIINKLCLWLEPRIILITSPRLIWFPASKYEPHELFKDEKDAYHVVLFQFLVSIFSVFEWKYEQRHQMGNKLLNSFLQRATALPRSRRSSCSSHVTTPPSALLWTPLLALNSLLCGAPHLHSWWLTVLSEQHSEFPKRLVLLS